MGLPYPVREYLERNQLNYQPIGQTPTGADQGRRVRAVPLQDRRGTVLAIHPHDRLLDLAILRRLLGRELKPIPATALEHLHGCADARVFPALARLLDWPAVIDAELATARMLQLPVGSRYQLLQVEEGVFRTLQGEAVRYLPFAAPLPKPTYSDSGEQTAQATMERLRQRVRHVRDLPAVPEIAQRILSLRMNPTARASDLADLVEADPGLATQVIRMASSALYGVRGRIESVRDAIIRVLGFDQVMRLALGIAIGRSFRIPRNGPLGLQALWRHSVQCSALAGALCEATPVDQRPLAGLAALAGLCHNFGRLLLGHCFPSEFVLVSRHAEANLHLSLDTVERFVIGVEGPLLGAWLMQDWQLPEEVVTAVRHHHRPDYRGHHWQYAALVTIADRLIRQLEEEEVKLPQSLLEALGLDKEIAQRTLYNTLEELEGLYGLGLTQLPGQHPQLQPLTGRLAG